MPFLGRRGRLQLEADTRQLNLRVVNEEERLHELLQKMGRLQQGILQRVSTQARDATKVKTVTDAHNLKRAATNVIHEAAAKKRLSPQEAEELDCFMSKHVNTSFGHVHENFAIRCYEQQTGQAVYACNEKVMRWHFPRDLSKLKPLVTGSSVSKGCSEMLGAPPIPPAVNESDKENQPSHFVLCGMIDGMTGLWYGVWL
jgi:hypothetical protein